jgi:hypothetical protein
MITSQILLNCLLWVVFFIISIKLLIDGWKMVVKKEKILILPVRMEYWVVNLIRGKEWAEIGKQKFITPFYLMLFGINSLLLGVFLFFSCASVLYIGIKLILMGHY